MKAIVIVLCVISCVYSVKGANEEWVYDTPGMEQGADWPTQDKNSDGNPDYPLCGGDRQSPIDLNSAKTIMYEGTDFVDFSFTYCDDLKGFFKNNGHTIQFDLDADDDDDADIPSETTYIEGGPLTKKYHFWQFHFHWGLNGMGGSEHTVDGQRAPGEVHLVHVNEDFIDFSAGTANVTGALADPLGLAVLGIFIVCGATESEDTTWFHPIEVALDEFAGESTFNEQKDLKPGNDTMNLNKMVHKINPGYKSAFNYWTYEGSLTTPACNEAATFIIAEHPLKITDAQMDKFENSLRDKSDVLLTKTYREIQDDNCRKVSYVKQNEESTYDYSTL